ncbi:DUF2637 domain-containing protein [Streptomyces sp. NPDC058457]|uniref:DUF2637 domain-containing protein n=1 Tax=Streptomyces sp. NPDC058457 TaxID=3346507 RepID=UPI003667FB8C
MCTGGGEGGGRVTRREEPGEHPISRPAFDMEAWVRPLCALVVAGVAAYASYVHQRSFALQGGADRVSASLWPLSVDGLLLLATLGLLKQENGVGRRAKWAVWPPCCCRWNSWSTGQVVVLWTGKSGGLTEMGRRRAGWNWMRIRCWRERGSSISSIGSCISGRLRQRRCARSYTSERGNRGCWLRGCVVGWKRVRSEREPGLDDGTFCSVGGRERTALCSTPVAWSQTLSGIEFAVLSFPASYESGFGRTIAAIWRRVRSIQSSACWSGVMRAHPVRPSARRASAGWLR